MARRRAQWTKYQGRIDPSRLVFIDETWTKTNMAPLRGWAPRGRRLVAQVPHGHWKTSTFLAALRHDRIAAPWLLEGPIDGESFQTYVEKVLVPTLRSGDIVIMDNLGSHKGKAVRQFIRAAGAKLISCRNTRPTSTQSNRSLPSSSICCAKPKRALSMPSAQQSGSSWEPLRPTNAQTFSKTQVMPQPKFIPL